MRRDIEMAVVEDLHYLRELSSGRFVTQEEIRRSSVATRRLFIDQDLSRVAQKYGVKLKFSAPVLTRDVPTSLIFFQTGGFKAGHLTFSYIEFFNADESKRRPPLSQGEIPQRKTLSLGKFLEGITVYYGGIWARRIDVIQYIANKVGGAHFGTPSHLSHKMLDDVRRYFCIKHNGETFDIGMNIEKDPPLRFDKNEIECVFAEMLGISRMLAHGENLDELIHAILTAK